MPTSKDYIDAHLEWLQSYVDRGFEITFLTVMFNPLPGTEQSKRGLMEQAICDCYRKAVKSMFRRPRSVAIRDLPLWMVCHDWPVWKPGHKMKRDHLANIAINDGLHIHGVCLTPPGTRLGKLFELDLHNKMHVYAPLNGPIHRIDASTVDEKKLKTVTRYTLKSLERRRIDVGDIVILPKSHSEFSRERKNETPRDAALRRMLYFALRSS